MKYDKKILIVEDDAGLNKLIQNKLSNLEFETYGVQSAEEAINFYKNNTNCFLLVDFQLEDTSGADLIKKLLEEDYKPYFIIMTGHGDEKTAVQMMKMGSLDYIVKDSNFLELIPSVISKALERIYIEERYKQSQISLHLIEKKNQAILNVIPDLMFIFDKNGVFIDCKDNNKDLVLPPKDFIGKNVYEILPQLAEITLSNIKKTLATGEIQHYDYTLDINGKINYYDSRMIKMSNNEVLSIVRNTTDKKDTEQNLKISEVKYKSVFNNTAIGICIISTENNILDCNEKFAKMFEYDETEIKKLNISQISYNEDILKEINIASILNKRTSLENNYQFEKRFITKNGRVFWGKITSSLVFDENNKPLYAIGLVDDVTERKINFELLKQSEEKYRLLIETATDVIYTVSNDGILTSANPAFETATGWKTEDYIGKHFISLVHPDEIDFSFEVHRKIQNGEKPPTFVQRILLKSGEYAFTEFSITPMIEGNEIVGTLGIARNITERRYAEKRLEESEERYRLLAENTSDFISKHDLRGNFIYASSICAKILEYEPYELINQCIFDFIHPEDLKTFKDVFEEITASQNPFIVQYRIRKFNEDYLWVETNASLVKIESDKEVTQEIIAVTRDISEKMKSIELIKAKEAAEHANNAKSAFLANISHEIRNPLNALIGMASLLTKSHLDETQQTYVESITTSAESLLNIINDVLDLSKIEANKLEVKNRSFNLEKLMHQIKLIFENHAKSKGIEYNYTIASNVPLNLYGDDSKIKQILNNLSSNAIKFTEEGSINIKISSVKYENDKILLKIILKDTGIGIKKEDLSNLFQAFKQLDSSTTKEYKGTGLGLSIVKSLVEIMDGTIEVNSEFGKGTEFKINIPLTVEKEESVKVIDKTNVEIKNRTDNTVNIMIVEDDSINQLYLKVLLQSHGWKTLSAVNGEIAVQRYKEKQSDIVLMDGQMPKMDGFQAAKEIRQFEKENNLKPAYIVALTGYAVTGDREKFLDSGMNEYVTKPIDEKLLLDLINNYINKM